MDLINIMIFFSFFKKKKIIIIIIINLILIDFCSYKINKKYNVKWEKMLMNHVEEEPLK